MIWRSEKGSGAGRRRSVGAAPVVDGGLKGESWDGFRCLEASAPVRVKVRERQEQKESAYQFAR